MVGGYKECTDDFFFLVQEEIEDVLTRTDGSRDAETGRKLGLSAVAQARRAAWNGWMARPTFSPVLDAAGNPVASGSASQNGNVLEGIGASRGQVTGRTRVILSPAEAIRLQPGDILVTRSTDPGWTPVFALVSGVVLEIGGQLSHGAIVAREYGLPAVVNVPGATRRIAEGQTTSMDGSTGCVWLDGGETR